MNTFLKKTALFALLLAMVLSVLPFSSVSADSSADPVQCRIPNDRLEAIWERGRQSVERLGTFLERSDQRIERARNLIEKASENGKDTTALEAALNDLETAVQQAGQLLDDAQALVEEHAGFNPAGKVMDCEQASQSIKALAEKRREIRAVLEGPMRAFFEALREFRENNPRPTPMPTSNP